MAATQVNQSLGNDFAARDPCREGLAGGHKPRGEVLTAYDITASCRSCLEGCRPYAQKWTGELSKFVPCREQDRITFAPGS